MKWLIQITMYVKVIWRNEGKWWCSIISDLTGL